MGPRLFGIPATEAPVVAILRRGPSGWAHVSRWDVDAGSIEAGAWLHGVLYPQRCDLSPDGRWLSFFTLKSSWNADWAPGPRFVAISRLPWLTALAAWGTDGTWTRGLRFTGRGKAAFPATDPQVGDLSPLLRRYALDHRRAASFAIERERGWTETADSPPRTADDAWDERRVARLTMESARPGDPATRLRVRGWYAAFRGGEPGRGPARYALASVATADATPGPPDPPAADAAPADAAPDTRAAGAAPDTRAVETPLAGVQWASWHRDGRLLVATNAGELQVFDDPRSSSPVWRHDLAPLRPDPRPAPPDARRW